MKLGVLKRCEATVFLIWAPCIEHGVPRSSRCIKIKNLNTQIFKKVLTASF